MSEPPPERVYAVARAAARLEYVARVGVEPTAQPHYVDVYATAAVDAVWPLMEREVRAEVAAEIRAACDCTNAVDPAITEACEYRRAARIAEGDTDGSTSGGVHGPGGYRSTACLHAAEPGRADLHRVCQTDAIRYDGTEKVAAQCKYGKEPCTCPCHTRIAEGPVGP